MNDVKLTSYIGMVITFIFLLIWAINKIGKKKGWFK